MTYASATLDDENETAIIYFLTEPPMGTNILSSNLKVAQMCEIPHPVDDFEFYFEAEDSDGNGLNPTRYEIKTSTSDGKTLSYMLQKKLGAGLYFVLTYEDNGNTEQWESIQNYPVLTPPKVKGEKVKGNSDEYSIVDFANDSIIMRYTASEPDFSWPDDHIISGNESYSIDDLTQHYMKLITEDGSVVFHIGATQGQDPMDYSTSKVTINYCVLGNYITYLHITQNELYATVE